MGICRSCTKENQSNEGRRSKLFPSNNTFEASYEALSRRLSRGEELITKQKSPVVDSRRVVSSGSELKNARLTGKSPTLEEFNLILSVFKNHYILKNLEENIQAEIINNMRHYEVGPREFIVQEGEYAENFFILGQGKVDILVENVRRGEIIPYSAFGDLALLDEMPRSASYKTIERSGLWTVSRSEYKSALERLNEEYYEENKAFIDNIPIFNMLNDEEKEKLVRCVCVQEWEHGKVIVREGEEGDLLYIIRQGEVTCTRNYEKIRTLTKGDFFGDQALLYDIERTATVSAIGPVTLLSINRTELFEALGSSLEQIIYTNSIFIAMQTNSYLKHLTENQIKELTAEMTVTTFKDNYPVITEGELIGEYLYIVLKGRVGNYKQLDCIGESEITLPPAGQYEEDSKSIGQSVVASIHHTKVTEILGGQLLKVFDSNSKIEAIKQVPLYRFVPMQSLNSLLSSIERRVFDNEIIFEEGQEADGFYAIKHGKVNIVKQGNLLRTMGENAYFGEKSLILNEKRSATVIAVGQVVCWVLNKDSFLSIIDEKLRERLRNRMALQDDTVELSDLVPIKCIGLGMSSRVYLCIHQTKNTIYALKSVLRSRIQAYDLRKSILTEKNVLLKLDHPMIMKLVKTFKDEDRLYFLLEHVEGMDLFDVLRHMGLVSEQDSKFYTCCLVVILDYLHEKKVIYRDLKPENVMIDYEGYPKLIDFGTTKIVKGRTYTTVGTPHYIAPEIIMGKGYSFEVDWWSLGVMVYELLIGDLPFAGHSNDPYEIYQAILSNKLSFPPTKRHESGKKFIRKLLNRNAAVRDFRIIKDHPWIKYFDWNSIDMRSVKTPFKPPLKDFSKKVARSIERKTTIKNYLDKKELNEGSAVDNTQTNEEWDSEF